MPRLAVLVLGSLLLAATPALAQWEALEGERPPSAAEEMRPTEMIEGGAWGESEGQPELPEGEVEAPPPATEDEGAAPARERAPEPAKPDNEEREGSNLRYIVLRGLNKVTAKAEQFTVAVGATERFGNLEVVGKNCWKAAPTERPESAALLDIWEHRPDDSKPTRIFVGWMFASSPSVSAMEHAVYDVTVIDCRRTEKEQESAKPEPAEAVGKPAEELPADDTGGY